MGYELRIGDTLDERFRITELIQKSGMSTIYKAIDCSNGRFVAIKVPHIELEGDAAYFARFEREQEIGSRLNHPGIVKVLAIENKSRPYMAMEYLEGRTLDRILEESRPLTEARATEIASDVCEILDYMHKHDVVHRDLKPANVMVCNDGSLRIIDFGIAKTLAMKRVTFGGLSPKMGTPHYMAPEQIKGRRGDSRTDIYSLGAILYEMTTGLPMFDEDNIYELMNARLLRDPRAPRSLNPRLSRQIEEIILHSVEREPTNRYESATAMKAELDAPESIKITERQKRLQTSKDWGKKLKRAGAVALLAVTPVLLFFLFLMYFQHQAGSR